MRAPFAQGSQFSSLPNPMRLDGSFAETSGADDELIVCVPVQCWSCSVLTQ